MTEGFFYKETFYVGICPIVGTNIEDWTNGYDRARTEILEDIKHLDECKDPAFYIVEIEKKWEKK